MFSRATALVLTTLATATLAVADIAIYADGRRAEVESPAKDSKGEWLGTIDGRRQRLKLGEIVALVDDKGQETSLIPVLSDGARPPAFDSALAILSDTKSEMWFEAVRQITSPPTHVAFDALVELAKSNKKELRLRAVNGLAALATKESSLAAAKLVLEEKDSKSRRDLAGALFSVREILRRSDAAELIGAGLADKDSLVRVEFALVAPHDLELATEVLRKDGLKYSDHHVRESAAVDLGLRGDATGVKVLAAMLARSKMPGLDAEPELGQRLLIAEQVEICRIIGKLGGDTAKSALTKARSSPHEAVRKAAEAALASIG